MTHDLSAYKTLYHIVGMQPRKEMSGFGFCVKLFPAMLEAVADSGITQRHIERWVSVMTPPLLIAHDYTPDYINAVRVDWGEWGPQHITVPGNACGLDIDSGLHAPPGGRILLPHNVDCRDQSHLLLCIFTGLMDILIGNQEGLALGMKPKKFKAETEAAL